MSRFIALMRGINVGGKHKLPMSDLRAAFEHAGAREVQTYIQSGNVVFEAGAREGAALGRRVAESLLTALGFATPILVRSAAAWRSLAEGNPFSEEAAADPKRVHAVLLDRAPSKAARAAFEPDCRLGERWVLEADVLYADYPGGTARSKLSVPYVDRSLGCISTGRNWRTVEALLERVA